MSDRREGDRGIGGGETTGRCVCDEGAVRRCFDAEARAAWTAAKERGRLCEAQADAVARGLGAFGRSCGAGWFAYRVCPPGGEPAEKYEPLAPGPDGRGGLDGAALLRCEVDASCLPSGDLRQTSEARGRIMWDPASEVWCEGGILFLPSFLTSPDGTALDERTPLRRAERVFSREAARVLACLGHGCGSVTARIGAEREFFLVRREDAEKRPDLLYTGQCAVGRPLFSRQVRGRHYLAPLSERVGGCLRAVAEAMRETGIGVAAIHAEAAPGQYEIVPDYTDAAVACDRDRRITDLLRREAAARGMMCLTGEKPFLGLSGSGKHINWSMVTDRGENLLSMSEPPCDRAVFLTFVTAVVAAAHRWAELWRASVASLGNDLRLGASEAPPPILSVSLGPVRRLLCAYAEGDDAADAAGACEGDRNRTSPLVLSGGKFEFRMPGAERPIRWVTTVWLTTVADVLRGYADRLSGGEEPRALIRAEMEAHGDVLFDGDGYGEAWQKEAARRGLPRLIDTPACLPVWDAEETPALFGRTGVLTGREPAARTAVERRRYVGDLRLRAQAAVQMVGGLLCPALADECRRGGEGDLAETARRLRERVRQTEALLTELCAREAGETPLGTCRETLRSLDELREAADDAYARLPLRARPYPDYDGMLGER